MKKNSLKLAFLLSFTLCSLLFGSDTLTVFFSFSEKYDQRSTFGGGSSKLTGEFENKFIFYPGTATDSKEADILYTATGSIASISTATIDLESLTDYKGTAFKFEKIKSFALKNSSSTNTISFGGTWIATETIQPLGINLKTAPLAGLSVSSITNKIQISTPSTSEYELLIIGIKE